MAMKRIIFIVSAAFVLLSCNKDQSSDERIFYGTWVKGTNTGDTLVFYQKGGKNILAYNLSFNPLFHAPTEVEYFYINGQLSIRYPGFPGADFPVNSLTWKQRGKEFEIRGMELYSFMSASNVFFTFRKL